MPFHTLTVCHAMPAGQYALLVHANVCVCLGGEGAGQENRRVHDVCIVGA